MVCPGATTVAFVLPAAFLGGPGGLPEELHAFEVAGSRLLLAICTLVRACPLALTARDKLSGVCPALRTKLFVPDEVSVLLLIISCRAVPSAARLVRN